MNNVITYLCQRPTFSHRIRITSYVLFTGSRVRSSTNVNSTIGIYTFLGHSIQYQDVFSSSIPHFYTDSGSGLLTMSSSERRRMETHSNRWRSERTGGYVRNIVGTRVVLIYGTTRKSK